MAIFAANWAIGLVSPLRAVAQFDPLGRPAKWFSELKPKAHLDLAAGAIGASDLTEVRMAASTVRLCESRNVRKIVEISTELELVAFRQCPILVHREVDSYKSGATDIASCSVAEVPLTGIRESRRIEPLSYLLAPRTVTAELVITNYIGTV